MNRTNSFSWNARTIFCLFLLLAFTASCEDRKVYDTRPTLSPAPKPLTDGYIKHIEKPHMCGIDEIIDQYTVEKSADVVKEYYFQEMTKLCRPLEGWSVTISSMKCYWEGIERECFYSACVLKDDAPDLIETFSVEICPVSPSQVEVIQNQDIQYALKNAPKVQCGE